MASDRKPVPMYFFRLEETRAGVFDEVAKRAGVLPPNTAGDQQEVIAAFKYTFRYVTFGHATDTSSGCPDDSARMPVTVIHHHTQLSYGKLGEPGYGITFGGESINIGTFVRFAVRPRRGTRWIACRTFEVTQGGTTPSSAFPITCSGSLTTESNSIEPGTMWRLFCLIPGSDAEFTVSHAHSDRRWMRVVTEVIELDQSSCDFFPSVPIFDLGAESSNGLLSYAACIRRAVEPSGWLVQSTEDDPAASAARSLARLKLLDVARRVADNRLPPSEATKAPWKQRRAFLDQALLLVARDVFLHYRPKLLAELQRSGDQEKRLGEIYATLQNGIRQFWPAPQNLVQS